MVPPGVTRQTFRSTWPSSLSTAGSPRLENRKSKGVPDDPEARARASSLHEWGFERPAGQMGSMCQLERQGQGSPVHLEPQDNTPFLPDHVTA